LIEDSLETVNDMKDAEAISHYFEILSMDTVHFIAPIEVGSIVNFQSTITYSDIKKGLVRTKVKCKTLNASSGSESTTTNTFDFTLKVDTK
jgi:acyl-CoA hydrolase